MHDPAREPLYLGQAQHGGAIEVLEHAPALPDGDRREEHVDLVDQVVFHLGGIERAVAVLREAKVAAAADACQAMSQPRPRRPALSPKQASDELRHEVRSGRLAADAVDAVLVSAGRNAGRNAGRGLLGCSPPAKSRFWP